MRKYVFHVPYWSTPSNKLIRISNPVKIFPAACFSTAPLFSTGMKITNEPRGGTKKERGSTGNFILVVKKVTLNYFTKNPCQNLTLLTSLLALSVTTLDTNSLSDQVTTVTTLDTNLFQALLLPSKNGIGRNALLTIMTESLLLKFVHCAKFIRSEGHGVGFK